jgi:hypothetical protein
VKGSLASKHEGPGNESFLWKIGTFEEFYVALLTARRRWLLLRT